MKNIMNFKLFSLMLVTSMMSIGFASCNNDESVNNETPQDAQVSTRSVAEKTPKLTVYVETNDINPLNMGEYYFGNDVNDQVIDHVILFASNIRGTATTVQLFHNDNQTYILNHRSTLIAPLQAKGVKVLLGLLGDHTGVGFANLTPDMINDFAQQVADCVNNNNLDGVDFDDEYAECGRIGGLPNPSIEIYGNLIQKVRQLLPNKLITAFRFSDSGIGLNFNQTALNALSYMWPDFGVSANPYASSEFANSKWAKLSIQYTDGRPSSAMITAAAKTYADYGAIMMFNMRDDNASGMMNYFAPYVWGGKTVSRTNNYYSKNY